MGHEDFVVNNSIWECYKQTQDIVLRNKIILNYTNLVKSIALKMRNVYNNFEVDDIISQGMLALLECVERFDFKRDVKFETFATIRIRGAVIDFLRKQDWVPRNLRKSAKKVEEIYMNLGCDCDEDDNIEDKTAKHLNMSVPEIRKLMGEISKFNVISYEELIYDTLTGAQIEIKDNNCTNMPDAELLKKEFADYLASSLEKLTDKEKIILSLYYSETLRFKGIAGIFKITESRVCQLHSKALSKLKGYLKEYVYE